MHRDGADSPILGPKWSAALLAQPTQTATLRRSGKSKSMALVTMSLVASGKRLQQKRQVTPSNPQPTWPGLIDGSAPIRSIAATTHAKQIGRLLPSRMASPKYTSRCGTVLRQKGQVAVSASLKPTGWPQDVQNLAPSASFFAQREH